MRVMKLYALGVMLAHYARQRYGRGWSNREAFERWQSRRIGRHLKFVRKHSPYYREMWEGRQLDAWKQLPMLDKKRMMDNFDRLNTVGIRKDEALEAALAAEESRDFRLDVKGVTVGLSSGTSGSRGLFLASAWERAAWAGTMLAKLLPGPLWRRERIAFFLRANSKLYESLGSRRLRFEYYDLMVPMKRHLERLEAYQPTILAAPPSVLRALAEAQRDRRIAIKPERVIAHAEVLDPIDRAIIEGAFGRPLHQVYQCTEGFLACTCAYGTLHLNEDIVAIEKEYVDDSKRRFVPIVTDYTRIAQPVVRYRLNDLLTELDDPCPCGSVMTPIARIEGRCDDIYYLPHREDGSAVPIYPDYVSRAVIAVEGIEEYRIIQRTDEHIEAAIRVSDGMKQQAVERAVEVSLLRLFERSACKQPRLTFTAYRFEPGAVKLRRIERSQPDAAQRHAL